MATELDKLVVKIEADLSNLKKGMAQANKQVATTSSKFQQSFKKIESSFDKAGMRALKFGAIIGTALGVVAIKGFVDTAIQIENLQVRLKALFGSAEEGALAFEKMSEFASKVPFSLAEIQQGAGALAVVSDDADHLAELMEITGNVASVAGLDFKTASEQIQRSLSGGLASADLFREKGISQIIKDSGMMVDSVEGTAKAFTAVFGRGGKFGNATDEMAKTLSGTLSMLGDKYFNFQKEVSEEFFGALKQELNLLNENLQVNSDEISRFARNTGRAVADAMKLVKEEIGTVITVIETLILIFAGGFIVKFAQKFIALASKIAGATKSSTGFLATIKSLEEAFRPLTKRIVGFLVALGLYKSGSEDNIEINKELIKQNNQFADSMGDLAKKNKEFLKSEKQKAVDLAKLDAELKEYAKTYEAYNNQMLNSIDLANKMSLERAKEELDELMRPTEELIDIFNNAGEAISDAFGKAMVSGQSFRQSMLDIFQSIVSQIISLIVQLTIIEPILKRVTDAIRGASGSGQSIGGQILAGAKAVFGFGGTRAGGGSVNPNMPYMVGERGAEMFVPKSAGTIVPNNQVGGAGGGGNIVIEQNLNFATGVSQTVRAEVMNLLPAIQQSTLSAVQDARLRGGTFAKDFGG